MKKIPVITAYWYPVSAGHSFSKNLHDEIKMALVNHFNIDKPMICQYCIRLDSHSLMFLKSLKEAGVTGASTLIDAIRHHNEIKIHIER